MIRTFILLLVTASAGAEVVRPQTKDDRISLSERVLVASKIYAAVPAYFGHFQAVPDFDLDAEYEKYVKRALASDDRLLFDLATMESFAKPRNGHSSINDTWLNEKHGRAQVESDASPREHSCGAKSARILVLGTYHMGNPGLDAHNLEADDVLLPRRQREIGELVDKLARYRPTKIAIEAAYRSTAWTDRYKKYVAGEHELGRNEIEQVGFRLARRLNLPTLYPVDYPMFMSGLTPSEVETPRPKPAQADGAKPAAAPTLSEGDKLLRRSTVTEFLRHMNRDETIRGDHAGHMEMLLPDDGAAIYRRADPVTNWYKRNLRMFANIGRVTEFPGDRVLVIVGAGHLKILKDLAVDSPHFRLVEAETYLK